MEETKQTENINIPPEETNDSSPEISEIKPKKSQGLLTESMAFRFMLVFGVVFMSFVFVFQVWLTPIKVIGSSMQPTINTSIKYEEDEKYCDIVYYDDKKAYANDAIVIVKNNNYKYIPYKEIKNYEDKVVGVQDVNFFIKRVIACPGQTITFYLKDAQTALLQRKYYYDIIVKDSFGNIVNLDESYLKEEMMFTFSDLAELSEEFDDFQKLFENILDESLTPENRKCTLVIPKNAYFVMGDNRNNSEDSRYFGFVYHEDIAGNVRLQIPYGSNLIKAIWLKLKSII